MLLSPAASPLLSQSSRSQEGWAATGGSSFGKCQGWRESFPDNLPCPASPRLLCWAEKRRACSPVLQEGENALPKTLTNSQVLLDQSGSIDLVCLGDCFSSFFFPTGRGVVVGVEKGGVNNVSDWMNKIALKITGQLRKEVWQQLEPLMYFALQLHQRLFLVGGLL